MSIFRKVGKALTSAWWNNPDNLSPIRAAMDKTGNGIDRHRAYAHGLIDAALEQDGITPEEMVEAKAEWDRRHA